MSTARVLITGVGGFVGFHLARRIRERGETALGVGVDPSPPAVDEMVERHWRADVRDSEAMATVIAEAAPTAIVHLAAQSSGALAFERPLDTYAINAIGTMALLDAARRSAPRARILVVGTGEVYGPHPQGTRVAEDAPLHPVSPYALSKAAADQVAETCGRLWNLDVVRTRSFGHIGPGQTDRFLVPSLARQIAEIESGVREPVIRAGNLDVVRDLTDVRDVVEGYLAILERGRCGAAYNVCRGEGTHLGDLTRRLCDRAAIPVSIEIDPQRIRAADVHYLVGDPAAVLADTGWKATIPLDRTLDEVMAEWRQRMASPADEVSAPAMRPKNG